MTTVAFLTYAADPELNKSDAAIAAALADFDIVVEPVPWRDLASASPLPAMAVIRSTWDYHLAGTDAFVAALTSAAVPVFSPPALVVWNANKALYLPALADAGVAIVPTVVAEASMTLADAVEQLGTGLPVVAKPAVSASARNTFRIESQDDLVAAAGVVDADPAAYLVQPFMDEIVTAGEWSLVACDDVVAYAAVKTPKSGDFRVQEEHGGSTSIVLCDNLPNGLVDAAHRVLAAAHAASGVADPFLYARIDGVVSAETGEFILMELELIEPYLFVAEAAAAQSAAPTPVPAHQSAPAVFAAAIAARLGAHDAAAL
ncbi:glutathione synthase/ribosomal protein S6 modification enzyme [Thecamonas trahens ATCC 50062]|uniref:Glutathione synthase/ribosomal protein S6 modification enzyme n=1 Tax=Thecamonas trahens ATCC 50062 TaxID=461836 RepID=A0A0L0D8Q3_THETB|nr:glutathione synthase/ribosomal protein S6 modification enzyme [Thecamonas trahens ATCC 50062]KNC48595.1 glutathione synthase/ribosomal protein S6 modification enzyme [Thecamonas trahens ATCC 50062]|eukprot:XP_013762651.1 glutathione synthase/ribosomal protein S6 modification enzyme [Thecamonas trahens ATCC 50062]